MSCKATVFVGDVEVGVSGKNAMVSGEFFRFIRRNLEDAGPGAVAEVFKENCGYGYGGWYQLTLTLDGTLFVNGVMREDQLGNPVTPPKRWTWKEDDLVVRE